MRHTSDPVRQPSRAGSPAGAMPRSAAKNLADLSPRGVRLGALAQLAQDGPAATAQRARFRRAFGPTPARQIPARSSPVAQRGVLYDGVKATAEQDFDAGDYNFTNVTAAAAIAAAQEIVAEYLASQAAGQEFESAPGVPLAAPQVQLSSGYGGVPGILLTPPRDKVALQILSGQFLASITHELGHMVKGKGGDARVRDRIPQIAAAAAQEAQNHPDAHPDPDGWVEEIRADLVGLFVRFSNGIIPVEADYSHLADEAADGEHPPGPYRMERMKLFMNELGHPW